ncbi:MAG TPA: AAA family ATPase, partial [Blastocatellia bacterium]|nr:AAA family ATPase [Blastocatellia bacterium]
RAGGAEKLLHFGSKVTEKLCVHVVFEKGKSLFASLPRDGPEDEYEVECKPTAADELVPSGEWVYSEGMRKQLSSVGKEACISLESAIGITSVIRGHLDSWRLYHFHDTSVGSPIKRTADVNDNRYLRPDGSNLASFLYYLKEKEGNSYGLIRRTVQRIAPFFDDFVLEPQRLNPEKIRLEWRHRNSEAYFDAASLSDGSLRFIALATLLLQPVSKRPSVILVDEPELGLHPYAITMLASLVKQASAGTQVILSTQSPMLLDHFNPEDVLVTETVAGATRLERLDSARLATWLEHYSLGQLWEKNEFGGRP